MVSEFIIPVRVENEQSLYSAFDPAGLVLSSELTDYLNDCAEDRRLGERICLEAHTDGNLDVQRLRNALLLFMQKQQGRNKREMVKCNVSALRLLLIGIVFIVIGLTCAAALNAVAAAIISTIGSFSVWEASAQWIEVLPSLRKKDRILNLLSEAEVRVIRSEDK